MRLKPRHWILALLAGVLLGLLGVVMVYRGRLARSAEPNVPPVPSPPPTEEITALPRTETSTEQTQTEQPAALPDPGPEPTQAPEQRPDPDTEAGEAMDALRQSQPGRWGLCFQRLPGGETVDRSTDGSPMVSASLIKLYIMGAVYEQIDQGLLERDRVYPSLSAMITVSDNSSANELVRLLGAGDAEAGMAAVNAWCLREGCPGTQMNRLMLADNGLQNYTTAADCARLLGRIYRGECVSQEASREMLALLLAQQVNDRLPLLLPEGTPLAHKTGDLVGLCWADVGIVFSPGGDYVLCVISDGQASEGAAKTGAAELSRQIYRSLNPEP